jgi:hypothetical protein
MPLLGAAWPTLWPPAPPTPLLAKPSAVTETQPSAMAETKMIVLGSLLFRMDISFMFGCFQPDDDA